MPSQYLIQILPHDNIYIYFTLNTPHIKLIPLKKIANLHVNPKMIRDEEEMNYKIINENLQFEVVIIFIYGWLDIKELFKLISNYVN